MRIEIFVDGELVFDHNIDETAKDYELEMEDLMGYMRDAIDADRESKLEEKEKDFDIED